MTGIDLYDMKHEERMAVTYTADDMEADLLDGVSPLDCSIKKWEGVVQGGYDYYCRNCALCKAYGENDCIGCPLVKFRKSCSLYSSPWKNWVKCASQHYGQQHMGKYIRSDNAKKAAGRMLATLWELKEGESK